jgi:hypothetical protein
MQEVAAYHLPLHKLSERRELITAARAWLKHQMATPSLEQASPSPG